MRATINKVAMIPSRLRKLRICHVSDTHGRLPVLYGRYDCVVHSGDFFPNSEYVLQSKTLEMAWQLDWLKQRAPAIKAWLQGRPFFVTFGNHDFLDADKAMEVLVDAGINAQCLHDKHVEFEGVVFYGFPYVPFISGMWNYERELPEMQVDVDRMVNDLNTKKADILVCHSPPYNTLDLTVANQKMGSVIISTALDYQINNLPSHYLCGHCHEGHGLTMRNGMLISNSATTQHILEIL